MRHSRKFAAIAAGICFYVSTASAAAQDIEKCAGEFVVITVELDGDPLHQVVVVADTSPCGEESFIKYQGRDEVSFPWVDEHVEPFDPKLDRGRFSVTTKGKPPWGLVINQKGFKVSCKIDDPGVANAATVVAKQFGYDTVGGVKAKKSKLSCNAPNVTVFEGCNIDLPSGIESDVTVTGAVKVRKGKFKNYRPAGNPETSEFCDADRLPFPLPIPKDFQPSS